MKPAACILGLLALCGAALLIGQTPQTVPASYAAVLQNGRLAWPRIGPTLAITNGQIDAVITSGPTGPPGPAGPAGPQGPQGPAISGQPCTATDAPLLMAKLPDGSCLPIVVVTPASMADANGQPTGQRAAWATLDTVPGVRYDPSGWHLAGVVLPTQ